MSQDQLLIKLFDEVAYVWPRVGYPPLVTPFSQYVKNLALMNVMQMEKGKHAGAWSPTTSGICFSEKPEDCLIRWLLKSSKGKSRRTRILRRKSAGQLPGCSWQISQDDERETMGNRRRRRRIVRNMHPAQYAPGSWKVESQADVAQKAALRGGAAPATTASAALPTTTLQVLTVDQTGPALPRNSCFSGDTANTAPAAIFSGRNNPQHRPLHGTCRSRKWNAFTAGRKNFFLVKNASDTPL